MSKPLNDDFVATDFSDFCQYGDEQIKNDLDVNTDPEIIQLELPPIKPLNIDYDGDSIQSVTIDDISMLYEDKVVGNLCDERMSKGMSFGNNCATCGLSTYRCMGHIGYTIIPPKILSDQWKSMIKKFNKKSKRYGNLSAKI
jgi:hypothetical protein